MVSVEYTEHRSTLRVMSATVGGLSEIAVVGVKSDIVLAPDTAESAGRASVRP
jgi:hypothetical protein